MKIIFLDFDGVLNPSLHKNFLRDRFKRSEHKIKSKDRHGYYFDPYCVSNLRYILRETDARIVVCSSWRLHVDITALWRERKLPGEIIGTTPTMSTQKDGLRKMDNAFHLRGYEVKDWLHRNKELKPDYVIIDDHPEIYREDQYDRMVACNKLFGLTSDDANKAIEILQSK